MNIQIHPMSCKSLKLELISNGNCLSTATGYIIKKNTYFYLVSNYHVFSGRDLYTKKSLHNSCATPEKIAIYHSEKNNFGSFIRKEYDLIDNNLNPLFNLHPTSDVDVGILKIEPDLNKVAIFDIEYHNLANIDYPVWPTYAVSIVGFPFGLSSHAYFPIWKIGHIASEISLPFQGQRCFLIDASTRGGMSGSPVYAIINGPFVAADGSTKIMTGGPHFKFLGTYSGRLNVPIAAKINFNQDEISLINTLGTDIGMVWDWKLIDEILS